MLSIPGSSSSRFVAWFYPFHRSSCILRRLPLPISLRLSVCIISFDLGIFYQSLSLRRSCELCLCAYVIRVFALLLFLMVLPLNDESEFGQKLSRLIRKGENMMSFFVCLLLWLLSVECWLWTMCNYLNWGFSVCVGIYVSILLDTSQQLFMWKTLRHLILKGLMVNQLGKT